ncbi:nicotinate (nicotinamide) nucleotide adenylyltransferase [Ruminococcus sp. Marseille-P6503]|uniref:nicotinate (nicotinamide) nucleotide adenylyltransferase n=1 Tax=Ruminococcus sp. Marseille-P6503 TaxID=2364796 RepID=UPI000F548F18|nr:nicotinate (nicotinamide) nucleotide adenylyltransferase [Ruminococcus sp. Marseille-P6503]
MNIGIFGGTFNPVHNGHVRLLKSVMNEVSFEKVIVLPSRIPPHKQAEQLADGEDRLTMCRLAFEDIAGAEVSDWELRQSGKSYSVITLRHFRRLYPEAKFFFIMGSDMLLSFHEWYRYEEILSLASLICISRSGSDTADKMRKYAAGLKAEGGEIIILEEEPFEVSSTQIREMIKKSGDYTCYLNKNVVKYIMDKNLY